MAPHDCVFPELLLEEGDEDEQGNLRAGMKVLTPCECGETPLDHMEFLEGHRQEMQDALLGYQPSLAVYHWAPTVRRKQILRYGLRPGSRPTTSLEMGTPVVCFADSPSWAWALSGGQRRESRAPWDREWDLWQTWMSLLQDPVVLATDERPSGIYEVRTEHRVYKRDLWLVGSRTR